MKRYLQIMTMCFTFCSFLSYAAPMIFNVKNGFNENIQVSCNTQGGRQAMLTPNLDTQCFFDAGPFFVTTATTQCRIVVNTRKTRQGDFIAIGRATGGSQCTTINLTQGTIVVSGMSRQLITLFRS